MNNLNQQQNKPRNSIKVRESLVINPNDSSCNSDCNNNNDASQIVNLWGKSRLDERNTLHKNNSSVLHSDDMVYTPGRQSNISLKLDQLNLDSDDSQGEHFDIYVDKKKQK